MIKKEFIKFGFVGCVNTLAGIVIIFILYDMLGCGYWLSSGIGYMLGSVWSYTMNKYFTFQCKGNGMLAAVKFVINVIVCYLVSYAVAKPVTMHILTRLLPDISVNRIEKTAFIAGMGLYTILNFLGQKYFCFRKPEGKDDYKKSTEEKDRRY